MRSGQRTLAHDRKLRRGRQRAADQRTEGENERSLGRERIWHRLAFLEQQPYAQPAAAEELAQNRFRKRHALDAARRNVDPKIAAVITEGRGRPFISLPRRRRGSARSRLRRAACAGSLTNRSPFRLATNEECSRSAAMSSPSDGNRTASVASNCPSVSACTSSSETPARSRGTPRNSTCMTLSSSR